MKRKTRKKRIVRRKRRVVRRNPIRSSFDKPTFGPFNTETRRVNTTTMAGMREAEKLRRAGWYQGPVTLFSTTYYRKRALPKSSIARQIRGNPARTNKAHFGYAKIGMELLGTGLKIKKGERVYMTPATNIPGGGFFVEPAYRTGLWKQVSDGSILIKPKDFDDEITYVEPRGEYRPTPQVKPDYKYGIYTGRGIARNSRRAFPTPRFVGKGEFIWKKISRPQRMNFLMESFRNQITDRDKETLAGRAWSFLPSKVKIVFSSKVANVELNDYR